MRDHAVGPHEVLNALHAPVGAITGPLKGKRPPVVVTRSGNDDKVAPESTKDDPMGTDLVLRFGPKSPIKVDVWAAPDAGQGAQQERRHRWVADSVERPLQPRCGSEVIANGKTNDFAVRGREPTDATVRAGAEFDNATNRAA